MGDDARNLYGRVLHGSGSGDIPRENRGSTTGAGRTTTQYQSCANIYSTVDELVVICPIAIVQQRTDDESVFAWFCESVCPRSHGLIS